MTRSFAKRALTLILIACLILTAALAASGCRNGPSAGGPDDGDDGSVGDGDSAGDDSSGDGDDATVGDDGNSGGDGDGTSGDGSASETDTAACPLCGLEVVEEELHHRPLAVVVDNAAAAQPQSGLNDACLVYEVLVEGGITRLVAFYLHADTAAIGPVRSLRPYMLNLTIPLGAVVAHVGGSPEALSDVVRLRPAAMNIDAFASAGPFRRSESRAAPHNTYTGVSLLRSASRALGYEGQTLTTLTPDAFDFAPTPEAAVLPTGQSTRRFTVTYAAPRNYSVTYDYDTLTGQWMRYLNGCAHEDAATGHQVRSATVIVLFAQTQVVPGDPEGRLEVSLTGSGQARIFCLKRVFEVRWSKSGRGSGFVFTDTGGNPVTLPPGPVWVLIVPPGSTVSFQ